MLAAFLNDYERDGPAWRRLAAVQRDEAKNCVILIDLIRRVNGTPSAVTGNFLGKALVVEGKVARLQFLNRGQQWVARKISEALPYLEQDFVRDALFWQCMSPTCSISKRAARWWKRWKRKQ